MFTPTTKLWLNILNNLKTIDMPLFSVTFPTSVEQRLTSNPVFFLRLNEQYYNDYQGDEHEESLGYS